ncbi:MAG: c-type cytochrome [Pseudomonadales bacterium]|nr:c-type cytochrome [Pseudomonadales bacterium]
MRLSGFLLFIYLLSSPAWLSATSLADNSVNPNNSLSFQKHCSNCHNSDAKGKPPFFPSLIEKVKTEDLNYIIKMILTGRFAIEADLAHVVPIMPGWDYLANEDIAEIINYLYTSAKVVSPIVTAEDVAQQRGRLQYTEDAVALSEHDFNQAQLLYMEKCAACHGVHREGAAGSALTDWKMRTSGTQGLKEILHYGTPWGMPNWGTSERLSAEDMSLMARFLQSPPPPAPSFDFDAISASWQELIPIQKRPSRRKFKVHPKDLFVSLLHDVGQVALIDSINRKIAAIVDTGLAPHSIDVSKNGRYLYVISRGGEVVMIDLYMRTPKVVAKVRIGYEARSLAISHAKRNNHVMAGAYWPPQITTLNPATLHPVSSRLLDKHPDPSQQSEARITQVISFGKSNARFIIVTNKVGKLYITAPNNTGELSSEHNAAAYLRSGSFDRSGQFFLIPADDEKVVVFDTLASKVIATIEAKGLVGGNAGSHYVDPHYGPVWATSAMGGSAIVVIGTDPDKHPENAWQVVRTFNLPSAGSLSIQTHATSKNLWIDAPLNAASDISNSVFVINQYASKPTIQTLPIASWADLAGHQVRVLHPQYNKDGSEVWFTVFDRQDRESAIVVVEDATQKLKYVLKDSRLVTPTRTFSIASMLTH